MDTPNQITVWNTPDGWIAHLSRDNFTAPTAFTSRATFELVKRELERLNPNSYIIKSEGRPSWVS